MAVHERAGREPNLRTKVAEPKVAKPKLAEPKVAEHLLRPNQGHSVHLRFTSVAAGSTARATFKRGFRSCYASCRLSSQSRRLWQSPSVKLTPALVACVVE